MSSVTCGSLIISIPINIQFNENFNITLSLLTTYNNNYIKVYFLKYKYIKYNNFKKMENNNIVHRFPKQSKKRE